MVQKNRKNTETSFSNFTLTAIEAALQAGEILRQGFGTQFTISYKEGVHNLVTDYDHISERAILSFIRQRFPESSFLAEEEGIIGSEKSDLIWIIDPLDGTVNFAHQIPMFAVSIAAEVKGEIHSGVVYHPITQELFVAEKGKGALLNGVPIQASSTSEIKQSILATGFPYNLAQNPHHCIEHFVDILRLGIPIRRLGAATLDLCYTASGRFDAFFEISLAPWDCAAALLILQESGGVCSEWDLTPFELRSYRPILASNGIIHHELSSILSRS